MGATGSLIVGQIPTVQIIFVFKATQIKDSRPQIERDQGLCLRHGVRMMTESLGACHPLERLSKVQPRLSRLACTPYLHMVTPHRRIISLSCRIMRPHSRELEIAICSSNTRVVPVETHLDLRVFRSESTITGIATSDSLTCSRCSLVHPYVRPLLIASTQRICDEATAQKSSCPCAEILYFDGFQVLAIYFLVGKQIRFSAVGSVHGTASAERPPRLQVAAISDFQGTPLPASSAFGDLVLS